MASLLSPSHVNANTEVPNQGGAIGSVPQVDLNDPLFTKTFAYVLPREGGVPVFATPEDALNNTNPIKQLTTGYDWVSLQASVEISSTRFVQINANQWVSADAMAVGRASQLQGRVFKENLKRPFAWVLIPFQPTRTPDGDTNTEAPNYKRYEMVQIYGKALIGNVMWYQIGENQWARQIRLAIASPRRAPHQLNPRQRLHAKWVSVSIAEQTLQAYEGDRLVFAALVASGLPKWETVRGVFQVWSKTRSQAMYNTDASTSSYYLEDVPYTMYFHEDFALHGAYWHDAFGSKRSHGCVNLSPRDAKWLFQWTTPQASEYGYANASAVDPGTWVWIY